MPDQFQYDVFLSHSSKDKLVVRAIAERLRADGLRVWLDEWEIRAGDNIPAKIEEGLEHSRVLLLCMSANAFGADWAQLESATFRFRDPLNKERRFIPLRLDQAPIKGSLGQFHYINWLRGEREEAYATLLEACRAPARARQQTPKRAMQMDHGERSYSSEGGNGEKPLQTTSFGQPEPTPLVDTPGLEHRYSNLFQISSLLVPYVVLVGAWDANSNEYGMGEVVCVTDTVCKYELPDEFRKNPAPDVYFTDFKCRLTHYDCAIVGAGLSRLTFAFSKIEYLDYLLSGEYLDSPLPDDPTRTFRDKYAPRLDFHDLSQSRLTNISGVGVFIITRDEKIIVSKHTRNVRVYGDTWTYSASGTMDWSENVNPYFEVARECFEEIGHQINLDNAYLFGFGIDATKLYCQFSFFEKTGLSSDEVIAKARMARDYHMEMEELVAVPFELESVMNLIKQRVWEPAASAGLLTLCAKRFGYGRVERAIDPEFVRKRIRNEMMAEWDHRASRPDDLAVMSARYPISRSHEESQKYLQAAFDFIGTDVDGKDVLEIGAGIGRMSEVLVLRAKKLTCLDLSSKMLDHHRSRLGPLASKVHYLQMFSQDYRAERPHDVVISSLVLIHNVNKSSFQGMVEVMKTCARTIFLFEHTDVGSQVSQHTCPRSEADLLAAFPEYEIEKRREYQIFTDNLIFLKLVR